MNNEPNLDFSGGPKSWFDLWHTHVDWDGEGNRDWKTRKKLLIQLLSIYDQLKSNLQAYPHDFQLFITIDENDSRNDSVNIHTRNPNANNFPLKISTDYKSTIKNKDLKEFVENSHLSCVRHKTDDGDVYYLYDKNVGLGIVL